MYYFYSGSTGVGGAGISWPIGNKNGFSFLSFSHFQIKECKMGPEIFLKNLIEKKEHNLKRM